MVKATCEHCGASHQYDDAEIPPSGKVVTCTCGAPLTVMHATAAEMGFKVSPHATTTGLGASRAPGSDKDRFAGGPAVAAFDDQDDLRLGLDDVAFVGGGSDLADITSPDRKSPLAGIDSPAPKKSRSALADALAAADQAAKKTARGPALPKLPAVPGTPAATKRPEPGGFIDLPAPKGGSDDIIDLPAPKAKSGGITDLPAPKKPGGITDLPAPKAKSGGITDLPAPKQPGGITDLPAPKQPGGITDLPAPKQPGGITDLPAPKKPSARFANLPVPKRPAPKPVIKPPTPTQMGLGNKKIPGVSDLPAPVGPKSRRDADLPTPVGPAASGDRAKPTGKSDLPAPKGFFDDLPQPHAGAAAGSAPMGFFDDLPRPAAAKPDEAAEFFDDLASPGMDVPAPKGFFDDLPQPSAKQTAPHGSADTGADDIASLDLDDLDLAPPEAEPSGPPPPAADFVPPLNLGGPFSDGDSLELAEPLDLSGSEVSEAPALDLGDGRPAAAEKDAKIPSLDLGDDPDGQIPSLDLGDDPDGKIPALELPNDDRAGIGTDRFGELDLPTSEPPGASVVSFSSPSSPAAPKPAGQKFGPSAAFKDDGLELDAHAAADAKAALSGTTVEDSGGPSTEGTPGQEVGKGKKAKGKKEAKKLTLSRRQAIVMVAIVLVAALGAGGFWFYQRHQAAEQRRQQIQAKLNRALGSMKSDKPLHWKTALELAQEVLQRDSKNDEALGIAAQAEFAQLIDLGSKIEAHKKAGRDLIRRINNASARGLEVDKAEALRQLVEGQPPLAIQALNQLQRKNPKDANVALYLGWAYTANHNHKKAIAAYTAALKLAPNRIPAQYGLAQAQLALGNFKQAREGFKKTFDRDKQYEELKGHVDHLGALVGYYRVKKVARFTERENLFLEVTKHKDADRADPRAVSLAWSLAGDQALRAGRVDEAKQRFDKALELNPDNLNAQVGQARADVAQKRIGDARRRLSDVLKVDPSNLDANLALAEVAVLEHKTDEAQTLVDVILERDPPLDNSADLARALMVQGDILVKGDLETADPDSLNAAIAEYQKAVELVGPDDDVRPTLRLANALAHHRDKAERDRGAALLVPLESTAANDPALATTLGLAWLSAGKADRAEQWFRTALERKPNDVETRFQLGLALYHQERYDEAIAEISKAHEADESREDIGLRLATIYEQQKRDGDAEKIYKQLLELPSPSLMVRARAGRFYARKKDFDQVRAQADAILAEKPKDPTGLFLRGEALAADGDYEHAVRLYQDAAAITAEPQFLDGLGRALEKVSALDDAMRAFRQAAAADPDYLSPRLGIARIRMVRREFIKGVDALTDAQRLDPDNPWILFELGECYRETAQVKTAIDYYRKSIKLDNTNDLVYYKLARAYYDLDRTSETAAALTRATQLFEAKRRQLEKTQPDYDEDWVTEGYRLLAYAERARGNRRGAIRAFEAYLDRNPEDRAEAEEAKRLLIGMRGH